MSDIFEEIQKTIDNNNVVLFMKGNKQVPMCGFSAKVVAILDKLNVDFHDVNILENLELREAIKKFSDWPTIPQLYVKSEFIGGCDIVTEMYHNNELQEILQKHNLVS